MTPASSGCCHLVFSLKIRETWKDEKLFVFLFFYGCWDYQTHKFMSIMVAQRYPSLSTLNLSKVSLRFELYHFATLSFTPSPVGFSDWKSSKPLSLQLPHSQPQGWQKKREKNIIHPVIPVSQGPNDKQVNQRVKGKGQKWGPFVLKWMSVCAASRRWWHVPLPTCDLTRSQVIVRSWEVGSGPLMDRGREEKYSKTGLKTEVSSNTGSKEQGVTTGRRGKN